jgi:hypothetical protein
VRDWRNFRVIQSNNGPEFRGRGDGCVGPMGVRCGSGYLALEELAARSRQLRSEPTLRTAWPAELAGSVQRTAVSVKEPESFFDPLSGSVKMDGKTVLGSGREETSSMRIQWIHR